MPSPVDPRIVDSLQQTLALHLSQAEAYELQAAHFTRWGYPALGADYTAYAAEERHHVKLATERLEFFDVAPEVDHDTTEWPRHDFMGILDSNYAGDAAAAEVERTGYLISQAAGDADSAKIFAELLHGSEDGMASIEATRSVVSQIGVDNYLANKTQADG